MKLTTTKDKILNSSLIAERITGKKESLPILSCVLLDVEKELSVKATNLESGVEIGVVCDVEERGVVAVPAQVLTQTLRSIRGDKVTLSSLDGNLKVESTGAKSLIKAVPHEEFPSFKLKSEGKGILIQRENLIKGIQAVLYAASPSMIRPELGSVYISVKDVEVVFVATDSFRLAERVIKRTRSGSEAEILIPLRHANELLHILERVTEENVELTADDSHLAARAGKVAFTSRVVAGTFPNYKEIMPHSFSSEATVLKNDFTEGLRKARVFSGNEQNIGVHLYPKRKIFTITAQSPDVGEMSDSLDAATSGGDIDINFNVGYLSDCIPSMESDSLTLGFSGVGKPLVIRGVSDAGFTYLVMPLNR